MSDYISRDAALAVVEDEQKKLCPLGLWGRKFASDTDEYDAWQKILEKLADVPTADVEPVQHGRWEWFDEDTGTPLTGHEWEWGWRCSCCKTELPNSYDNPYDPPQIKYCSNCGAKMDL